MKILVLAGSESESLYDSVKEYIQSQEEHHRRRTFQEEYLEILRQHQAPYDERLCLDIGKA